MRRALGITIGAVWLAAALPAFAQATQPVCQAHDPRVEAAFARAAAGEVAGATTDLRSLTAIPDPSLLMDVAQLAMDGLPKAGPLRAPEPELAIAALEKAAQIAGNHVPQALFLLSEIGRDTGLYTEDRQNELRHLAAALGYEPALIELARELANSDLSTTPEQSLARLELLLQGAARPDSTAMTLFVLELLDRPEIAPHLSETAEDLTRRILATYETDHSKGNAFAATSVASAYARGVLVEQDLEKARQWLLKIEPCWRAREFELMGDILRREFPNDSRTPVEHYRRAAELGSLSAALSLVRMRTEDQVRDVADEEAVLWLRRALQLNELRAVVIWMRAVDAQTGFPAYDPREMQTAFRAAEKSWTGDGRTAASLGRIYQSSGAPWYDDDRAAMWFERAALANDPTGMLEHGRRLRDTDPAEARQWIERALAAGSVSALVEMADILMSPPFSEDSLRQAEAYLQRSVDRGSLSGLTRLALLYMDDSKPLFDQERGETLLEDAADQGSSTAQTRLAQMLLDRALAVDPAEAAILRDRAGRYLVRAAAAGSLSAKHLIGNLILLETKDPEEVARAIAFLNEAADGGRVSAMIDLAEHYIATAQLELAVQTYRRAADLGSVRATLELARAYSAGLGVQQDEQESLRWLAKAEQLGQLDVRTLRQLGASFANGTFGRPDQEKGLRYYRRAAELGDPSSMMYLSTLFSEGKRVPKDDAEAFRWALAAAEAGSVSGMVFVGEAYNEGLGTERDTDTALGWMQKALESNPNSATAAIAIGRAYELGLGFEKDKSLALQYYERAANLGNISAMVRTARSYLRGVGVKSTPEVSVAWYDRAARAGNVTAMLELAQLHAMGYGTPLDSERAFELYLSAADAGSTIGMREAARLYIAGVGTTRDLDRGVAFLERAARQGDAGAMRDLWVLYDEGFELAPNPAYARVWLERAAKSGHYQATYELASTLFKETGELTPDLREMVDYAAEGGVKEAKIWKSDLVAAETAAAEAAAAEAEAGSDTAPTDQADTDPDADAAAGEAPAESEPTSEDQGGTE